MKLQIELLLIWILNALALLAVANFVPGIHVEGFTAALIAAFFLGLVNTLIRPLLLLRDPARHAAHYRFVHLRHQRAAVLVRRFDTEGVFGGQLLARRIGFGPVQYIFLGVVRGGRAIDEATQ